MVTTRKVLCISCGATNFGVQEACMICKARLPDAEPNVAPPVTQLNAQPASIAAPAAASAEPALERVCRHCGARINPGTHFCVECGTPAEATRTSPPGASVCRNCRTELTPDIRFCV